MPERNIYGGGYGYSHHFPHHVGHHGGSFHHGHHGPYHVPYHGGYGHFPYQGLPVHYGGALWQGYPGSHLRDCGFGSTCLREY